MAARTSRFVRASVAICCRRRTRRHWLTAPCPRHDTLDLTDERSEALARLLSTAIDADRYPLSPRIRTLKEVFAKIRPEPTRAETLLVCSKCGTGTLLWLLREPSGASVFGCHRRQIPLHERFRALAIDRQCEYPARDRADGETAMRKPKTINHILRSQEPASARLGGILTAGGDFTLAASLKLAPKLAPDALER